MELSNVITLQTYIELNNFLMFQKTEYFEEPEKFKAERWLRDGSAQNIHPFILTPFSHGPRMCVGKYMIGSILYYKNLQH